MAKTPPPEPPPGRATANVTAATDALKVLVGEARATDDLCYCLYLLALEELDHDFDAPFTAVAPDAELGRLLDWVRTYVQQHGRTALEHYVAEVRYRYPRETRLFGHFLPGNVQRIMLAQLGRLSLLPGSMPTARLSPDNPLRLLDARADGALVWMPYDVEERHLMDLRTYFRSLRPVRQPGRPRKAPEAPRTPQRTRRLDPALAQQAWDLKRQGLRWPDIARGLWSDRPVPTEHHAREALRQRVRRLCEKGRLDAER
jgi:hypothetical protein